MKILLVGEFSGFYKNLREGLRELGHEATIAAARDGYKKIDVDIDLDSGLPSPLRKIVSRIKPALHLPEMTGYDVVQFVNPYVFGARYSINNILVKHLIKNNRRAFLSAAGSDAYFWKFGRRALKYGPFDDTLKYDYRSSSHYLESDKAFEWNRELVGLVDGVIPIMHEYAASYVGVSKLRKCIPLPINTHDIKFNPNHVREKLVIFHGLTRYGFKGTRYVEEAFNILRSKYPHDLELIIDGKMPLEKYLDVMRRSNVVIDQVLSHSCGMNALYAMAMGKVVIGGAERESLEALGVSESPVINIEPSVESIVSRVEGLLERKSRIQEMGIEARKFVEEVHGHVKVAKKYVDAWGCER